MDVLTFTELMRQAGATDAQMRSNTYKVAEKVIAENSGEALLVGLDERVDEAVHRATTAIARLDKEEKRYEALEKKLDYQIERVRECTIEDRKDLDAYILFANMLGAVKQTFGEEKMTEAVICKAIEASSYGLWRSIMGESKPYKNVKAY